MEIQQDFRESFKCASYGDVPVFYLGKQEFVKNKSATGRKKDLADLEALGEA